MNLESVTFGNQVAENEADNLSTYFVETQAWKKLYKGEVDIIFGSKGAGKSALYTLLLDRQKNYPKIISSLFQQKSQLVKPCFLIYLVNHQLKNKSLLLFGRYTFAS